MSALDDFDPDEAQREDMERKLENEMGKLPKKIDPELQENITNIDWSDKQTQSPESKRLWHYMIGEAVEFSLAQEIMKLAEAYASTQREELYKEMQKELDTAFKEIHRLESWIEKHRALTDPMNTSMKGE